MSVAKNKLLALVNRDNQSKLVEEQVTFGIPAINPDVSILRNTKLRLTAVAGKGFRGYVDVWYNRIDLGILFKNVSANVGLDITEGMTSDVLIPLINEKYGTQFEVEDFDTPTELDIAGGVATMTAKVDNVAYISSFDVKYGLEEVDLDSVILITTLTGFNYPNSDTTKGQAGIYSYNLDGSSHPTDYWGTLAVGEVTEAIVAPFNQAYHVDETWVFDAEAGTTPEGLEPIPAVDFNLAGAEVIYNGEVTAAPAEYLINPVYTKVVLIKLSEEKCANFGGVLSVYHAGKNIPQVTLNDTSSN